MTFFIEKVFGKLQISVIVPALKKMLEQQTLLQHPLLHLSEPLLLIMRHQMTQPQQGLITQQALGQLHLLLVSQHKMCQLP